MLKVTWQTLTNQTAFIISVYSSCSTQKIVYDHGSWSMLWHTPLHLKDFISVLIWQTPSQFGWNELSGMHFPSSPHGLDNFWQTPLQRLLPSKIPFEMKYCEHSPSQFKYLSASHFPSQGFFESMHLPLHKNISVGVREASDWRTHWPSQSK